MNIARQLITIASISLLGGCGYFDSRNAKLAEYRLIGLTSQQLQSCAGTPAKKEKLGTNTELFQYTGTKNVSTVTGTSLIPVSEIATATKDLLGGNGSGCTAIMRLDYGRVSEVHYTGDADEPIGSNGLCAAIVRSCVHRPPGVFTAEDLPIVKEEPTPAPAKTAAKPAPPKK